MGKKKQNLHTGDVVNLLKPGTFAAPSPHIPLGPEWFKGAGRDSTLNNPPKPCVLRWVREWPSALRQLEPHSGVPQDGTVVSVH